MMRRRAGFAQKKEGPRLHDAFWLVEAATPAAARGFRAKLSLRRFAGLGTLASFTDRAVASR